MKSLIPTLVALCLVLLSGCAKKDGHTHGHSHAHTHTAPHGGTLVELGDHAYNLELLRDRATGKLTAWVLDGHAEKFVRIPAKSFQLVAMPAGKYTPLTMQAVANAATGETIGDTSQFEAQADWLKTAGSFSGIFTVEVKGTNFHQVEYTLPE